MWPDPTYYWAIKWSRYTVHHILVQYWWLDQRYDWETSIMETHGWNGFCRGNRRYMPVKFGCRVRFIVRNIVFIIYSYNKFLWIEINIYSCVHDKWRQSIISDTTALLHLTGALNKSGNSHQMFQNRYISLWSAMQTQSKNPT